MPSPRSPDPIEKKASSRSYAQFASVWSCFLSVDHGLGFDYDMGVYESKGPPKIDPKW